MFACILHKVFWLAVFRVQVQKTYSKVLCLVGQFFHCFRNTSLRRKSFLNSIRLTFSTVKFYGYFLLPQFMFFVLVLEKQPIRTLYAIYMYKVFWLDDFVVPVQNLHWENLWLSTGLLSLFLENIYKKRKKIIIVYWFFFI
jgi:hypothetical protein